MNLKRKKERKKEGRKKRIMLYKEKQCTNE